MPKMMNLVSTGLRRSSELANRLKQKYGLFDQF